MLGFGGGVSFDPQTDIYDLAGKVALVTGGNSGLGVETVKQLAAHDCTEIWLAARTRATAESTASSIRSTVPKANIILLDLDLGSFTSIKTAAETFNAKASRLDLLICNAGVAFNDPGLTESGYETQFGTNHMGHALLTKLLLPKMLETAKSPNSDVRNVFVNSDAHRLFVPSTGVDLQAMKTTAENHATYKRYGMSKLAEVYLAKELSRRYSSIKTVSIHPGAVFTGIGRSYEKSHPWLVNYVMMPLGRLAFATAAEGAKNQLWAATADGVISGEYYDPVGKAGAASTMACDEAKAKEVWDWTESELASQGFAGWP